MLSQPSFHPVTIMPEKKKRVYISWDEKEKKELRAWLARHRHLPWKKIREEYLRQKKKPRSIHSIRSKYDQLERELNPTAIGKETTKDIGPHYPPSLVSQLPPSPPPLDLPPMDPSLQEMIQHSDVCMSKRQQNSEHLGSSFLVSSSSSVC